MAESSSNKGILIAVVVLAVVLWVLFNKAQSTVGNVNKSVKQTYTPTTAASAVVTAAAPALGTFLSNLARPNPQPYYSPSAPSRSSITTSDAALSDDALAMQIANDQNTSAAFLDDSFDF